MSTVIYRGAPPHNAYYQYPGGALIPLDPRLDLAPHSPTGFSWGYGGSGPAQLALAILAHYAGDEVSLRHYQAFKAAVVARFPQDQSWQIESLLIMRFIESQDLKEAVNV